MCDRRVEFLTNDFIPERTEAEGTWLRGTRAIVYYSVVEVLSDRLPEAYLNVELLKHIWEDVEGVKFVDKIDQERLESAHGALLSLFIHRRGVDDVAEVARRYSEILLLKDVSTVVYLFSFLSFGGVKTELSHCFQNDKTDWMRLKEDQVRLALKTILKTVESETGWKYVVERIAKDDEGVRGVERLISLIDAVESHQLVSLCELIKARVLVLEQGEDDRQAKLIKDLFTTLAGSDTLDQARRVIGLRWWLENCRTSELGISVGGLARL